MVRNEGKGVYSHGALIIDTKEVDAKTRKEYLKKVKNIGPDLESVCKEYPKWNDYIRKSYAKFVKLVAIWKVGE